MKRLALFFATGFGLGRSPFAPGTVGSLPGVLLVMALATVPWHWQLLVALVLSALAIPLCDMAEKTFATKDDHRIVADEYLTFPLCAIGIDIVSMPWILAVLFVLNRIFDIWKPFPARQAQHLKGGLGIVADDFVTSLYVLALLHGGLALWRYSGT